MIEIDKAFEKVDNEITKSFEMKREQLKTEVTKVKSNFEKHLSDINNIIKTCDKITKGIKSLEKEEKNMLKTLSYVSKINKNQKEMRNLLSQLMINLKLSYIEEESKINYEEYGFSGIPSPKNIEFKEIGINSFKVFWKIDDINILNVDKKEIKYRIEMRKENLNDKFKQIYEGNELNYLVDNLDKNTNYDLRICSIYKDIIGNWTEIYKVKTKNFDSTILNEVEKGEEYLQKLHEWTGNKKMQLLYRGTRDGSEANTFHSKCNGQGPTLILCKNEKNNIFGAYASISWSSNNSNNYADGSFLFTLTNIHGAEPTKYTITQNAHYAIYDYYTQGPTFGGNHDLYISDNYLNNNSSYASLGYSYNDALGRGNSIFSGDNNTNNFKLKEMEVFKFIN